MALSLLHSQLFVKIAVPTYSFAGQTVIVTGANTGLGREAARHFVRLGASRVILGVRTPDKGEAAKEYIEEATGKKGVCDVWQVDLSSYSSVKEFVQRAQTLDRIDAVVENAGMWPTKFQTLEDNEATITVNVISTFLMALALLPKLRETASKHGVTPHVTVVGSALHKFAKLPAKYEPSIFAALAKPTKDYGGRYNDSKLLVLLYGQELAAAMTAGGKPKVVLDFVSPGYCASELVREPNFGSRLGERLFARSTDEGARTLVDAVTGDSKEDRHGQYINDLKVGEVSPFLKTQEGKETGKRVYKELNEKLELISPGVTANI